MIDLQPRAVQAAAELIDPIFRNTAQFTDGRLNAALGREVVVKVETLNPIGSFKARGASVLARELPPGSTWVCQTAGNFGQALAYVARSHSAAVEVFVSAEVPQVKVERMRALGARVEVADRPEAAARNHAEAGGGVLVVDGLGTAMAEGAGTIGLELEAAGELDTVVVQIGDGALISGVACWLRSVSPRTRIVGVCASGAPAMAQSYATGEVVAVAGPGTIATALAITEPSAASLARVSELVDEIVLVEDADLRRAMELIANTLGLLVEPAGAAGIAALLRHGAAIPGERVAAILTGSGGSHPSWSAATRDGGPLTAEPREIRPSTR